MEIPQLRLRRYDMEAFWRTAFDLFQREVERGPKFDVIFKKAISMVIADGNEEAVLEGKGAMYAYLYNEIRSCGYQAYLGKLIEFFSWIEKELPEQKPYEDEDRFKKVRRAIFDEVAEEFSKACEDKEEISADICFTFFVDLAEKTYPSPRHQDYILRMIDQALEKRLSQLKPKQLERWMISRATPDSLRKRLTAIWARNGGYKRMLALLRAEEKAAKK